MMNNQQIEAGNSAEFDAENASRASLDSRRRRVHSAASSSRVMGFLHEISDSKLDPRILSGGRDLDYPSSTSSEVSQEADVYHELKDDNDSRRRTNIFHTYLNIIKSFVGSGFLFIPSAFMQGGILFSNSIFALSLVVNLVMIRRLAKFCRPDFESIAVMAESKFGAFGKWTIDLSVYISQMSFVSVYMTFVARTLREVVLFYYSNEESVIPSLMWFMLAQVPIYGLLSMVRRIRYFSFSILIADVLILSCCTLIFGFIVYQAIDPSLTPSPAHGEKVVDLEFHWFINKEQWPLFLGFAAYTWEGIVLVLPVRAAMEEEKKVQFNKILTITMSGICLFFSIYGSLGYYAFGYHSASHHLETLILANLPMNLTTNIIRIAYSFALIFSIPLVMYPAQQVMDKILYPHPPRVEEATARKWVKNISRWGQLLIIFAIACKAEKKLDLYLALIGSICCIPIAYIYPPAIHFALNEERWRLRNVLVDAAVFLGGFGMLYLTTYQAIYDWNHQA